jgi:hypothetical protein
MTNILKEIGKESLLGLVERSLRLENNGVNIFVI